MNLGKMGEEIAERYLKNKGYVILCRNFRCRQGEIDIIATFENTLVFIEVKTRSNLNYGLPCEAINSNKKNHIKRVAMQYLFKAKVAFDSQRIDVIEILQEKGKLYIKHTENAF